MSKATASILAIIIFGFCYYRIECLALHSHIDQLQADSIQSHKRIFQLTNQITKDTTHKWCIKMQ